jgi:hypothetical protein
LVDAVDASLLMKVLTAHVLGWLLRFVGYWLAECGHRIEAWAGIEPERVGGTD